MKKIILAVLILSLLFVQCGENGEEVWNKDGVYQPTKKISKIYVENDYYAKRLSEEWVWSGNNLSQIILDSGESITYHFSYDDKNRVTKMYGSDDWMRLEFSYNDKGIKRAEAYEDNVLVSFADYNYSDGKVHKMTFNIINSDIINSPNAVKMLSFIVPYQAIKILKTQSKQKIAETQNISIEFNWVNDNITNIELFNEAKGEKTSIGTITYQYDNKKNPYKDFTAGFFFRVNQMFFQAMIPSKNNVVNIKESMSNGRLEEVEYTLKYDEDDFPVEITTTEIGSEEYAFTLFYEYK